MGLLPMYPTDPPAGGGTTGTSAQGGPDGKKKKEGLTDAELEAALADMYADAFDGLARWYAKAPNYSYPEARARRRGKALARVLKKAGWDDVDIILTGELVIGGMGDLALLSKLKEENAVIEGQRAEEEPAPKRKKSAPAEVKEAPV